MPEKAAVQLINEARFHMFSISQQTPGFNSGSIKFADGFK